MGTGKESLRGLPCLKIWGAYDSTEAARTRRRAVPGVGLGMGLSSMVKGLEGSVSTRALYVSVDGDMAEVCTWLLSRL